MSGRDDPDRIVRLLLEQKPGAFDRYQIEKPLGRGGMGAVYLARHAVAARTARTARTYPGWSVDPGTQLTVTVGSTEEMISTCLACSTPATRWSSSQDT